MEVSSRSLKVNKYGKLLYFTFPSFEKYTFVRHAFSSRIGGVSVGNYESLNLGFNRGDSYENVYENYRIFSGALGIAQDDMVFSSQEHDINIRTVSENDKGKGIIFEKDYTCVDGLITNIPGIPIVTLYADCVPLFFLDPVKRIIGLAHAGWKGTVKKIGREMIITFVKNYNSDVNDIIAGIAPSIGPCCFEVSEEVAAQFAEHECIDRELCIVPAGDGKYFVNLWEINKSILLGEGIKIGNITVTDLCTKCNKNIFFSHRGHHGRRGSLAAVMQLSE